MIAVTCALALGLLPASSRAADEYEIYSISALTGSLAYFGKTGADALAAYETYFNKSGGINGRPIHFVIEDAQTNPQVAVQLFDELAPKGLPAILGPTSAAECNAVWTLTKNGPLAWCYSSAVSAPVGSFGYESGAGNYDYNVAAVRWVRGRRLTRLAVITPTDAGGQTYDRSIESILTLPENHSLTLVSHEHFNPSDVSVAAQISKVRASGAQVLFVGTSGSQAALVFHGVTDVGLNIPVISGNGNASKAFLHQNAGLLPKEFYVESTHCLVPASVADRAEKAAIDTYTSAMTARGFAPDCYGAFTWDPALVVTTALRRLGTNVSPERLRAYIASMRIVGVNGTYDFKRAPQRGLDRSNVVISRWNPATETWVAASKPGGEPL